MQPNLEHLTCLCEEKSTFHPITLTSDRESIDSANDGPGKVLNLTTSVLLSRGALEHTACNNNSTNAKINYQMCLQIAPNIKKNKSKKKSE
jgi:hypothetical protein